MAWMMVEYFTVPNFRVPSPRPFDRALIVPRVGLPAAPGFRHQHAHELMRHFFKVLGISEGALHHRQSPREGDHEVRSDVGIATELSPSGRRRQRVPDQ